MLATLLFSLTLAQGSGLPTLTPEDVARDRVVAKYEDKRVIFRGWLAAVRPDEGQKGHVFEVRASFYDQAAAGKDLSPHREVRVFVCFARDTARLHGQFRRAQEKSQKLFVLVEGKVVRRSSGWRLEKAVLKDSDDSGR
jgi:hypothetical protein